MSVRKRHTTCGTTDEYHYEFMSDGKRYCGVCKKCTTARDAEIYEKKIKAEVKKLSEEKDVRRLVENFRDKLTGGTTVFIRDGYSLSLTKPRKRIPSSRRNTVKVGHWNDFSSFMESQHPDIKKLSQVTRGHAEEYIAFIRKNGRFSKDTVYQRGKKTIKRSNDTLLSNATLGEYQMTLAEVFSLLKDDAGIIENPFSGIPKMPKESETREAFTEEELKLIGENLDDFTRPLFTIAIATALREGDICTLLWSEVDFKNGMILRQRMRKTGHPVEIPIMPELMNYLLELKETSEKRPEDEFSKYVLPEHAKMYLMNSSGVSYRIKHFLEDTCKIKTTRIPEGRSRAVSVKDLHSCRHTFCYYAGLHGIPLPIVQSIVGHMTPEMTAHYSAHASREMKREKMAQMPVLLKTSSMLLQSGRTSDENEERTILHRLVDTLSVDEVKKLITLIRRNVNGNKYDEGTA